MSTPSGGASRSHWAPYGSNEDRTEVGPSFYDEIFQTDICREMIGSPAVDEAVTYGTPTPVGGLVYTENDRAGFQGDKSMDSPTSALMNRTIASLSPSGASRPNWNSNMTSTASRRVAALPS